MLGIIFMALEDFLDTECDSEAWSRALEMADLEGREHQPDQDYPEEEAMTLFGVAAELLGAPLPQTLERMGMHMSGALVEMGVGMGLMAEEWTTMDILENLPFFLPAAIEAQDPTVEPPDIRTLRLRHGETAVAYLSERHLCPLLKGIILGLGEYFDEPVTFHEPVCMLFGAPLCRMSVTLDDPVLMRYVDVPREFETIRERGDELTFFNQFQGVPISGKGWVEAVDGHEATVRAAPVQLAAMQHELHTFISAPHLPIGLSAQVHQVDPATGTAHLYGVNLADGHLGRRASARVAPGEAIKVRFALEDRELRAQLINISTGGASLALRANAPLDELSLFNPVWISLTLPLKYIARGDTVELGPQDLEAWGNLMDLGHEPKRMVVRVLFSDLTDRDRMLVEEYLKERRKEVLPALKALMG